MKKILGPVFLLNCVLGLTPASFAQDRGGIRQNHGIDHDGGGSHDRSQPKTTEGPDHVEAHFEARIERNPALKSKVESLLPAGENLQTAATGFKNEGQFIAALHVSSNLGIPFDQLKAKMMSNPPMSLGQAIHALKPALSDKEVDTATETAEKETKADEKTKSVTKPLS